jgi:hypothetical protein
MKLARLQQRKRLLDLLVQNQQLLQLLHPKPPLLQLQHRVRLRPLPLLRLRNHLLAELEAELLQALMLVNSQKLPVLTFLLFQAPVQMGVLSLPMSPSINLHCGHQPLMPAMFALPLFLRPNLQRKLLARFLMLDLDSRISLTAQCAV